MNQLATGNSAVDNAEWNAALRASALVNRESSVVSEAGLNPLKAIPNNLLYSGIPPQRTQTGPDPVFGLAVGSHAGSSPGCVCGPPAGGGPGGGRN